MRAMCREAAKILAEKGAHVVLAVRDVHGGARTAEAIRSSSLNARVTPPFNLPVKVILTELSSFECWFGVCMTPM